MRQSERAFERLARGLMLLAVSSLIVAGIAGWGWYRSASRSIALSDLDPSLRQQLVEEFVATNPGIYEPAWFEPEIGFTLKRNAEIEAWGDSFTSNELGYRSGPLPKRPGALRILFVGDSWTYGMGIREEESFPKVLQELANRHAGLEREIESWTLALPGYNTLNELAALWFFFDRLAPDAVVLVPSSNDNESLPELLPDGRLYGGTAGRPDRYGDPHHVAYRQPFHIHSYRYLDRFAIAFRELVETEKRLAQLGVPSVLLFLARWSPESAHGMVSQAELDSPYAVVPIRLTLGEWLNPSAVAHGNPAANRVYAHLVYDLLATRLGWPPLPPAERPAELAEAAVFEAVPPSEEGWESLATEEMRRRSDSVPAHFRASDRNEKQWAGPGVPASGAIGRATTLLVRKPPRTRRLDLTVRRLETFDSLYPLQLRVSLPHPGGEASTTTTVPGDGPAEHRFSLEVPAELDPFTVLDVVFVADRVAAGPGRVARSVAIDSVIPRRGAKP